MKSALLQTLTRGRTRDQSGEDGFDIALDGVLLPVRITRNRRAKRMILRLTPDGSTVLLTLPPRSSVASGKRFVTSQTAWIGRMRKRGGDVTPFADGAEIPVRGVLHRIVAAPEKRGAVRIDDSALIIPGDLDGLPAKLTRHLKREARRDLDTAVSLYADRLGHRPEKITVRDTRTRWGSCSSSGTLSFSWRLILAPPDVLAYVAAHEVAHLEEMNHGPDFWATVERIEPEYESAKGWLKINGPRLHRYG